VTEKTTEKTEEASEKTTEKTEGTTEKTSVKILKTIQMNAHVTIREMAEAVGVSTRSVERNLETLQQKRVITRIGPDKGGHWELVDSHQSEQVQEVQE